MEYPKIFNGRHEVTIQGIPIELTSDFSTGTGQQRREKSSSSSKK